MFRAPFRLLVCGGRDYQDAFAVFWTLDRIDALRRVTMLIHGGARGADFMGGQWAEARYVPVRVYPADWRRDGRAAGPIRNRRMLNEAKPDLVLAFPGGAGTADMIRVASSAGVYVVRGPL